MLTIAATGAAEMARCNDPMEDVMRERLGAASLHLEGSYL